MPKEPPTPVLSIDDPDHPPSLDLERLIGSRMLIQANSGGGKSHALRYILEQTHARIPQLILDPEGEFVTLREKYDYVLAGHDLDIPAHPAAARILAQRLMQLGVSAVIDLSEMKLGPRRTFIAGFLDELVHLPRDLWRPTLLVIDEAHMFAPERGHAESTDAVIAACTLGRKRALCPILATQRLSKLHKDAAAELLNVMIGRTGLDVDVRRAGDTLGFSSQERQTLIHLAPGTFYTYGPAIAKAVTKLRTGAVTTKPPPIGKIAPPAPPAPRHLKSLIAQLAGIPEEASAEATNLRAANDRIAELTTKLRTKSTPDDATTALRTRLAHAEEQTLQTEKTLTDVTRRADNAERTITRIAELATNTPNPPTPASTNATPTSNRKPTPRFPDPPKKPPAEPDRATSAPPSPTEILSGEAALLRGLGELRRLGLDDVSRDTLAIFVGRSRKSGSLNSSLASMLRKGWIEIRTPGNVSLTSTAPPALTEDTPPIANSTDLQQRWLAKLPTGQSTILAHLLALHPTDQDRSDLAHAVERSATSGSLNSDLAALHALGLADYPAPGRVRASDQLFLPT